MTKHFIEKKQYIKSIRATYIQNKITSGNNYCKFYKNKIKKFFLSFNDPMLDYIQ